MGKKGSKGQRSKPILVTTNNGNNDDEGNDQQQDVGWSAIPGKRLPVDIANDDENDNATRSHLKAGKKRTRPTVAAPSHANEPKDDEFATENWTSNHYDDSDGEDSINQAHDEDLFDPDPLSRKNKFDAGSKLEGANDAGMFLSLEVIPGDAYQVQKTGDETSGFVTKVVFNESADSKKNVAHVPEQYDADKEERQPRKDNKRDRARKKREAREAAAIAAGGKLTDWKPKAKTEEEVKAEALLRLERKKLKRKAKKEVAQERKRLKKEQHEKSSSMQNAAVKTQVPQDAKLQVTEEESNDEAAINQVATTWSIAAPGLSLHTTLASGLHSLKYAYPTPIQASSLPAAILGRRDIVGAAPTGSGKTLSYGLPILQYLLETADSKALDKAATDQNQPQDQPLQILTPTRELAMQATSELQKVSLRKIKIGTIVGVLLR